jgi:Fe-S-cluster containining protein
MSITIAPPPVVKSPPRPAALPPRNPAALGELWPPGVLAPGDSALLRRPYRRGRRVPFRSSKCGTCIALCCRYIATEVDGPDVPKDFEILRWFLLHERTQLFIEGRKWFLQVFLRCRELAADNACKIHATRPSICREYEPDGCDRDEVEERAKIVRLFRSAEELDVYAAAWTRRYKAARLRRRRESRQKRERAARRAAAKRRAAAATARRARR